MNSNDRSLIVRTLPALSGIPSHRPGLLFVSNGQPRFHGFGMQISINITVDGMQDIDEEADDPSTIYSTLPVHDPKPGRSIPKLPYFPSYSGMDPEQRALYLHWLCDISVSIEIGYVFVYYYGLERHLVIGDFDAAFNEILCLRKYHNNGSFQLYSASALVHACLIRKRPDKLQYLYTIPGFDFFDNTNLLIMHHCGLNLSAEAMLRLATTLAGVNRRYLRSHHALYGEVLIAILRQRYGVDEYPFAKCFSLEDVDKIPYPLFANISLPDNVRTPHLPNLLHHSPFQKELGAFFNEVHETVKLRLKDSSPKQTTHKRIKHNEF